MNAEEKALYQRIEAYEIDVPGVPLPFSARLAREQGWSTAYTQRAIKEYKRFVFLAMVAGHVVTPSEAVDQVWHEHMTYTRSYWEEFCARVLGRQLHHEPTQGGMDEQGKFYSLYTTTLDSYRRYFDEEPPADIWESPHDRFAPDKHHEWINRSEYVLINRLSLRRLAQGVALTAVSAVLVYLVAGMVIATNPYDLVGTQFLQLYAAVSLIGLGVAVVIRSGILKTPPATQKSAPTLDAYQTAYLNQGASLAAEAVITRLVAGSHLVLNAETGILKKEANLPPEADELEQTVYRLVPNEGVEARRLYTDASRATDMLDVPLRNAGLLADAPDQLMRRVMPFALLLGITLFGGGKIWVGMMRERPVVILVGLCLLMLGVAAIGFGRRVHRSSYGDAVLRDLKAQGAPSLLSTNLGDTGVLAFNIALFGAIAVSNGGYGDLRRALHPPSSDGSGGAIYGGDGGGGGGCGGGGCGGGCGGCGGG